MERMRVEQHTFLGGLWFAGWLFTIGFLHLDFWRVSLRLCFGLTILALISAF